ncbi:MAG: extracellular solute-binding protein [Rubrivivax sp.]
MPLLIQHQLGIQDFYKIRDMKIAASFPFKAFVCAFAASFLFVLAPAAAVDLRTTVYTSTDQEYAEIILAEAESKAQLKTVTVFDAEAAKTVGLERRLVAEKGRPKADIFWNSEFLRTHRLFTQGVLAATTTQAPAQPPIPAAFISGHSIGFGIRTRVVAVNTMAVAPAQRPSTLDDLTLPRFKGQVAVSNPLFGATSTHFAALHAQWGAERFTAYLKALKKNDVVILPGNADVRDAVAAGRVWVGLTDSDDAVGAIRRKQALAMIFPDQAGEGAFGLYMTVARIAGRPDTPEIQRLIDYLSSEATEKRLIDMGAVQFSVRPNGPMAPEVGPQRPKIWFMDPARVDASLAPSAALIKEHLL